MIISDPDQSLEQAKTYLTEARGKFQNLSSLFCSNFLLPREYKDAVKALMQIKDNLDALLSCVNAVSSFSPSDQPGAINTKALIDEHLHETLIPLVERRDAAQHQTIREELQLLGSRLDKIQNCFLGTEDLSPSVHRVEPEPDSLPPDQSQINVTANTDWKTLLINTLLTLRMTNTSRGRDALLSGIPEHSLTREPGIAKVDLSLLIDELDRLGHIDPEKWALIQFINNALPYFNGFPDHEKALLRVRELVEDRYRKRQNA